MTTRSLRIRGLPYVPGIARGRLQPGLQDDPGGKIVLLEEAPSCPFRQPPAGFVMIDGAPFSHRQIPLLGSGIPGIQITRQQAGELQPGMELLLDGSTGLLSTDLTGNSAPPASPAHAPVSCTRDGMDVELRASARNRQAVEAAIAAGAPAIGLLRSEFLEPQAGELPDTAFYRTALRQLCEAARGRPLTIRLFDLAVSKCPAWLPLEPADAGILGRQGVRLYGEEPMQGIYRAQLQAIAKLATAFEIRVLLPYVADLAELQHWHADVRQRLLECPIMVGAMAETPAAALQLREWLEIVDFVSIGCNDLMQCLFGADRDHPGLQRYLDPHAPALYRFLRQVADAIPEHLNRVQLCGVLPQLPGILPLLLGLGYRAFSVEPALLPYLWQTVGDTDTGAARALAERVCKAPDSAAVRELLGRRRG